jgi:alkyldihydroxyacetonephosphate synthase
LNAATELAKILGPGAVSTDPSDLNGHAGDSSAGALIARRRGLGTTLPSCVVRPTRTEEVVEVLSWADRTRTPVVCFGGGSGVCRAVAPDGGIALDMRGMGEILDVDEKSRVVTVQAGVGGGDLAAALAGRGFLMGHQPQSMSISTVGGWIATKACGQLSARYGGIENILAGLEAVLPGGRVVKSKVAPRRSTGPDVGLLMVGSEGALGVVTQATLRIHPVPEERADLCVGFDHMSDAVAACRSVAQSDLSPTVVRLYDPEDALIFFRNVRDGASPVLLLVSFEGRDAAGRARDASTLLTAGVQQDAALVAHWWDHRNDAVEEYLRLMAGEGALGRHAAIDTMEVAAPWSSLRDLYHGMKEALSPLADIVGCHLSHIYPDGACLYFTLAKACSNDDDARAADERWWEVGMRTCLASGGTISHHHGIGRLKARWLAEELGGWLDVLRGVKAVVDPNGIMNPGALGL